MTPKTAGGQSCRWNFRTIAIASRFKYRPAKLHDYLLGLAQAGEAGAIIAGEKHLLDHADLQPPAISARDAVGRLASRPHDLNLSYLVGTPRAPPSRRPGSNRRPVAYKATALPAELRRQWPRIIPLRAM